MLLISRPSDACSGGIWGSLHEQHGAPGTSAEGHKVPPGQDQGKESPPPSHNPRSAAQNERGVAEPPGTTRCYGQQCRSRQYWHIIWQLEDHAGPGPLFQFQDGRCKVGDGGEGSYLSSGSGQLNVRLRRTKLWDGVQANKR